MKPFKRTFVFLAFILTGLTLQTACAQPSKPGRPETKARVGVFDSRAVAMAYYRSEEFKRKIDALHAEREKARAKGDEKRVQELEAEGPGLQDLVHKQGFGVWPVDNILEKIRGELPGIAKQAGVDLLVSKWDIVYQKPGCEFVDVTDLMAAPFAPDKDTLKVIQDIQKKKPIPIETLEKHRH